MLDPDSTPGRFLVDQAADAFHTTTAGQTSNGRLGDALGDESATSGHGKLDVSSANPKTRSKRRHDVFVLI